MSKLGIALVVMGLTTAGVGAHAATAAYPLQVLPPEHKLMKDPITGVDLLFVSASSAKDHNLYFHQRSWISDDSMVLFRSDRPGGELMGYLFATGELVCLTTPTGALLCPTAAWEGNRVYAYRPPDIVEITLKIEPSADVTKAPSTVTATERLICTLPAGTGLNAGLTENRNGTLLGLDLSRPDGQWVAVADVRTGEMREVCHYGFAGHLQFSITNPDLMSVAGTKDRLVVIDLSRGGQPRIIHHQVEGEYVTHECW